MCETFVYSDIGWIAGIKDGQALPDPSIKFTKYAVHYYKGKQNL